MIPHEEIGRVFQVDSMETAPENSDSDPVSANIFKTAMAEVLTGDDNENKLAIKTIMESMNRKIMGHINNAMINSYDYRVYCNIRGQPQGVIHMLLPIITGFIRYGNVMALDVQVRVKNTFGWGNISHLAQTTTTS